MGCDIHLYTEYKKTINEEEKWVSADNYTPNPYYGAGDSNEYEIKPVYDSRDYHLFAQLAGVRKYHDAIPLLSEPKGIPKDSCVQIKVANDYWSGDGHSHSYATLQELYEFRVKEAWNYVNFNKMYDLIADRAKDRLWVFRGEMTEEQRDKFRIVFWFDN